MLQTSIKQSIHFSGKGLHSGEIVSCSLQPAVENTGIMIHVKTPNGIKSFSPTPEAVKATELATTLGFENIRVSTVEHLLATIRGLEIDNIHIYIDGQEIPVLDGSSSEFIRLVSKAGIVSLRAPRCVYKVASPVMIGDDQKYIKAEPYDGFLIDYTISFPHKSIGKQRMLLNLVPSSFFRVASARTFGFLEQVEALKQNGLALGGGLDNAIVLDDNGVINEEGLRYEDEFVRHKILDFIGDMAVLPLPIQGRFTVYCSGHSLNNQFARFLLEERKLEVATLRNGKKKNSSHSLIDFPNISVPATVRS